MSKNLHQASTEWATRPSDQRFWTVDDMHAATKKIDESRKAVMIPSKGLKVEPYGKSIRLVNDELGAGVFNNWSFRQLCNRSGAPAEYMMRLRDNPKLAAQCINHGLSRMEAEHGTDDRTLRVSVIRSGMVEAFTSDKYAFIPNWRICEGLRVLEGMGWRTAPARPSGNEDPDTVRKATKEDVLKNTGKNMGGLAVKVGDDIAPAGLYASDRDMFAFLVNEGNEIDDGNKGVLNRGVFITNSEVGANAFRITTFLYDAVCGNHIVWGASDVSTIKIRHIGAAAPKVFAAMETDLSAYLKTEGGSITKMLKRARMIELGKDKESTIEEVLSRRRIYAQRSYIASAWDLCAEHDADRVKPNTLYGQVVGLTRLSQQENNVSERMKIDDVARRLLATVN